MGENQSNQAEVQAAKVEHNAHAEVVAKQIVCNSASDGAPSAPVKEPVGIGHGPAPLAHNTLSMSPQKKIANPVTARLSYSKCWDCSGLKDRLELSSVLQTLAKGLDAN